jgi:hypothetical protein
MKTGIPWLRFSYWMGALIDTLAAIQMLDPAVFAVTNRIPNFQPSAAFLYAMRMGASLMLGWTFMLLWADRRPMERKFILLVTVIPVIAGFVIAEILAVASGLLPVSAAWPVWALQTILTILFLSSYRMASIAEQKIKPSLPAGQAV